MISDKSRTPSPEGTRVESDRSRSSSPSGSAEKLEKCRNEGHRFGGEQQPLLRLRGGSGEADKMQVEETEKIIGFLTKDEQEVYREYKSISYYNNRNIVLKPLEDKHFDAKGLYTIAQYNRKKGKKDAEIIEKLNKKRVAYALLPRLQEEGSSLAQQRSDQQQTWTSELWKEQHRKSVAEIKPFYDALERQPKS